MAFACALALRYYALEPVQIADASMYPKFKERSVVWVCKLPQCAHYAKELDVVSARLPSGDLLLRKIIAMPGDTISISDKGKVHTPHREFKWKDEDAFIQTRKIYVPKAGDTLVFDDLNDVEQDYLIAFLRGLGEDVFVKTSLWQGDREINIDRVGATKIANRQVSLKEVDFLPWQDRYLIELQIRQSEPGNSPIKLKRKLFRRKKVMQELQAETPDSVDISLSLPDAESGNAGDVAGVKSAGVSGVKSAGNVAQGSSDAAELNDVAKLNDGEEFADSVSQIVITKDCYFLACEKGASCPDSRELGYFTADRIVGLHLKKPDEFKARFIEPAASYFRGVKAVAKDLWNLITETWDKAYSLAIETFKPEKDGEKAEGESDQGNE